MEKVISNDGTSIAFDRTGKGPALVLVDGAFCFRAHGTTPRLVPLLSDHFTVYAYDRRGRGDSGDTKPYDVKREVEDLMAVVDATEQVPFVCGFSSGAALIMNAVPEGLQVKKIALFEPPFVNNDKGPAPADAIMQLEALTKQNKRDEATRYFLSKVVGVPRFAVWLFKLFGGKMYKNNERVAHTLAYDLKITSTSNPKELGSKITSDTIVIGGDKSPRNLIDAVKRTASEIPNSKLCLLKGQNHNVSMKVLAPVLIEYFK